MRRARCIWKLSLQVGLGGLAEDVAGVAGEGELHSGASSQSIDLSAGHIHGGDNQNDILAGSIDVQVDGGTHQLVHVDLGSNAIVGTFADNLTYLTDVDGDEVDVDLWWSQDDRLFKWQVKWTSGVAYYFPAQIVLGTAV